MKLTRLNLSVLRPNKSVSAKKNTIKSGLTEPSSESLSRRKWLGIAGGGLLSLSPALNVLGSSLLGEFKLESDEKQATFWLGGKERWIIDTRRFSGKPKLTVSNEKSKILISLDNAFFPGTTLPADFHCAIRPALIGWEMLIKFRFGLDAHVAFEPWLLERESLSSRLSLSQELCKINPSSRLFLSGKSSACFWPDWTIEFSGDAFCKLSGFGEPLKSDKLTLNIPDPSSKSLMQKKPAKRTLIMLERGENTWVVLPKLHDHPTWQCAEVENAFDTIELEAGENQIGFKRYVLVASTKEDRDISLPALRIAPSPQLASIGNEAFSLPLQSPRYAIAFNDANDQKALVARFAENPVWLTEKWAGIGIEVGSSGKESDDDEFEIHSEGNELSKVKCSPALIRTQMSLPDALTLPIAVKAEKRLAFVQSGGQTPPNMVQVTPQIAQVQLKNPRVSVVRPEDLLQIDFEFINLKLSGSGENRELVKDNSSEQSYIVANFPPQHIAEEAFFESSDAGTSETPKNPGSVQARLARQSRLVFRVSSANLPIAYTLESLLNSCKTLSLNVSPAASVLTKEQLNALKALENAKKSLSSVKGMVENVQKNLESHSKKRTPQSSSSVQKSVGALQLNTEAIQSISGKVGVSNVAMKRLQTLQNAISVHSISDPELATHYTAEYQNLLDTAIQEQDKISMLPAISSTAMANAAEQIIGSIKPQKPTDVQTSIELPWHLYLSPHSHAGWAHASLPVTNNGRTELWHTRLGFLSYGSVTENYALFKTLRAIWSEEYADKQHKTKIGEDRGPESTVPFRMSLDAGDRYEIVELSSNFAEFYNPNGSKFLPTPIEAHQLMLSSLGAWLNLYGFWDTPSKLSIESWRHRGTMGRDHYVRVVYRGYLFPFGHKAVLVKVTERKFQKAPNGETVAYLRQHLYIIVREPEKTYPGEGQETITDSLYSKPDSAPGKKDYGRSGRQDPEARKTPFRRARITTLVTPNLDKAEDSDIGSFEKNAFWPRVGGADFEFHFTAEDWEGNRFDFTAPLIFVKKDVIENGTLGKSWDALSSGYVDDWINNNDALKRNTRPMFGQRIAIADPSTPGSTTFETESITIGVELNLANRDALLQKGKPHFYPTIERAKIRVKSLESIAGKNEPFDIELYQDYVKNGFSSGQVFAKFLNSTNNPAKIGLNFSSDNQKSGGLLAPNMTISGLSRSVGAVAGNLDSMAQGVMNPGDVFKDVFDEAKLFGAISLSSIIDTVNGFESALDRVPKFQREVSGSLSKTSFSWNPLVKKESPFEPKDPYNCLSVSVSILTPLNGGTPKSDITAVLHDFSLAIPFIEIPFSTVTLEMKSGEKADVNVVVGKPHFTDSLEFMNDITNVIPLDGFSDPPYMEIDSSGIRTGFSLAIPTIGLGMVTIQNVTLGAELGIPFIGRAMQFSFLFCEKENPFTATVYCIGGGGYFGLVVEPNGVASIDAAIEFGGSIALNIGIAAGAVYIMAGIYYQYVKFGDTSSAISAYVRIGGSLCVLGIVTVSIEFRIDLTYLSAGKLEGSATLKIKIKIFFVKKTFSRTVTRKICGTANDPLVKDVISEDDWKNYLAAFAA